MANLKRINETNVWKIRPPPHFPTASTLCFIFPDSAKNHPSFLAVLLGRKLISDFWYPCLPPRSHNETEFQIIFFVKKSDEGMEQKCGVGEECQKQSKTCAWIYQNYFFYDAHTQIATYISSPNLVWNFKIDIIISLHNYFLNICLIKITKFFGHALRIHKYLHAFTHTCAF